MKKNIILTVIVTLIVGFAIGYFTKDKFMSDNQGAAVTLSGNDAIASALGVSDSVSTIFAKNKNVFATYRIDPATIKSSVVLSKITKDTKPFTMNFPKVVSSEGGTTITPPSQAINCGLLPGSSSAIGCCSTTSNDLTITNPATGFTATFPGVCKAGEWDFAM